MLGKYFFEHPVLVKSGFEFRLQMFWTLEKHNFLT